jgi:hypothetical protein
MRFIYFFDQNIPPLTASFPCAMQEEDAATAARYRHSTGNIIHVTHEKAVFYRPIPRSPNHLRGLPSNSEATVSQSLLAHEPATHAAVSAGLPKQSPVAVNGG